MAERIIEFDEEYKGYRIVGTFTSLGHRCGYAAVPNTHELHGVEYTQKILPLDMSCNLHKVCTGIDIKSFRKTINNVMAMELTSPEELFRVHGGIMYSGNQDFTDGALEKSLFWYGFDCGHSFDAVDAESYQKYYGEDMDDRLTWRAGGDREMRNEDYVRNQCRNLVDQLIEYQKQAEGERNDGE